MWWDMLDLAGDLGFRKAITIILGLGEDLKILNIYSILSRMWE
jgi:biotin synthase-like enzyme